MGDSCDIRAEARRVFRAHIRACVFCVVVWGRIPRVLVVAIRLSTYFLLQEVFVFRVMRAYDG